YKKYRRRTLWPRRRTTAAHCLGTPKRTRVVRTRQTTRATSSSLAYVTGSPDGLRNPSVASFFLLPSSQTRRSPKPSQSIRYRRRRTTTCLSDFDHASIGDLTASNYRSRLVADRAERSKFARMTTGIDRLAHSPAGIVCV